MEMVKAILQEFPSSAINPVANAHVLACLKSLVQKL
ncbi:hypothetical protein EVA_15156 [gut metagenome]|uniref:Uncharacterized protein n=1 Tax=gut metagenome TaxID=749906 RepID=J9FQH8_9ZZZZ